MVSDERGQTSLWIALLLGLAVGLGLSLTLTWQIWPVQYYDTDPIDLRPELKEDYIVLVSAAYSLDGDLDKAKRRLTELRERDIGQVVADLAERYIQDGRDVDATRGLAKLAYALGTSTSAILAFIVTPTPSPTPSPTATLPPLTPPLPVETWRLEADISMPTVTPETTIEAWTPTPTPGITYRLVKKQRLCKEGSGPGRILIYVEDETGQGIPGVGIKVSWPGGKDVFFTGLKPEVNSGYADFEMKAGEIYEVSITNGQGAALRGLEMGSAPEDCPETAGGRAFSSWQIVFRRVP